MTINQLFKNKPPIDLINKLLNSFNIDGVTCDRIFSVKIMEHNNAIIKSKPLLKEIEEFWVENSFKISDQELNNIIKN